MRDGTFLFSVRRPNPRQFLSPPLSCHLFSPIRLKLPLVPHQTYSVKVIIQHYVPSTHGGNFPPSKQLPRPDGVQRARYLFPPAAMQPVPPILFNLRHCPLLELCPPLTFSEPPSPDLSTRPLTSSVHFVPLGRRKIFRLSRCLFPLLCPGFSPF